MARRLVPGWIPLSETQTISDQQGAASRRITLLATQVNVYRHGSFDIGSENLPMTPDWRRDVNREMRSLPRYILSTYLRPESKHYKAANLFPLPSPLYPLF